MSRKIPLCEPAISGREWEYVKECLDAGWVSSVGSFVDRFETEIAQYLGRRFGVATNSGTAALHVSLRLVGVRAGDEVLMSTLTFIAPANAVRYLDAVPVFVDSESCYWQLDVGLIEEFLRGACDRTAAGVVNKSSGRRIAAIVPVHVLGHPVDIDALRILSEEFEIPIVEDATESLGSKYKGRLVGTHGTFACLSFNGNKLITTGGGGMIVTDDETLAIRARHLTTQANSGSPEYIHDEIGYNYRLSNIQAAIGCAQLERIAEFIECKRTIAARYAAAFASMHGFALQREAPWATSSYWLPTVEIVDEQFVVSARSVLASLAEDGIQARPLWQPLHLSAPHKDSPSLGGGIAQRLWENCLSLPCSSDLSQVDQDRVIEAIVKSVTV